MKLNKLIFPLVIALTATLAVTGCKKGPTKITALPGQTGGVGENPFGPQPLGPGAGLTPGDSTTGGGLVPTGGGPTADWDPNTMNQDHSALAAYTVHFKFDDATVVDKEQSNISAVASALSDPSLKLLIEGNCDDRGTEEYNRSLGER